MESLVGPARVDIMASIALLARKIDTLCASYISYRYVHTSNARHLSLRWQSGMYVVLYCVQVISYMPVRPFAPCRAPIATL